MKKDIRTILIQTVDKGWLAKLYFVGGGYKEIKTDYSGREFLKILLREVGKSIEEAK